MHVRETLLRGVVACFFLVILVPGRVLGLERSVRLGSWVARLFGPLSSRHKVADDNLRRAFPHLSSEARQTILDRMWDNLGQVVAEYFYLGRLARETWRIEVRAEETLCLEDFRAAAGKGVLAFSGHCANWEILPLVLRRLGMEAVEVYRPLKHSLVGKWLVRQRQKHILPTQIPKHRALRPILRHLKAGHAVAVLLDQRMRTGIEVPFFGSLVWTPTLGAVCVQRTGCLVMPAWGERLGPGRFRIKLYDFLTVPLTEDREADIRAFTEQINAFLEARIREKPEAWLWVYKRWK